MLYSNAALTLLTPPSVAARAQTGRPLTTYVHLRTLQGVRARACTAYTCARERARKTPQLSAIVKHNANYTAASQFLAWIALLSRGFVPTSSVVDSMFAAWGNSSPTTDVVCGVPRGSVIGPILFIIYTADLAPIVAEHGLVCRRQPDLWLPSAFRYLQSVDRHFCRR